MSIERTFSKSKHIGNRTTWSDEAVLPLTVDVPGIFPQGEFATIKIPGRQVYCLGYQIEFRAPAASRSVDLRTALMASDGQVPPLGVLNFKGVQRKSVLGFMQPVPMPAGSLWQLVGTAVHGAEEDLPEGLVVTYLLRYATRSLVSQNLFQPNDTLTVKDFGFRLGDGSTFVVDN